MPETHTGADSIAVAHAIRQRPGWSEALSHPLRTFHTVRHLQARQLVYQALRRVQPITGVAAAEGELSLLQRQAVPQAAPADGFDGRSFNFLNRRIVWEGPNRWYPAGADDLWIFNLHYFKFLDSTQEDRAQELIFDWLALNRDPREPAWHPYPISLRVREWTEWLHAHPDAPLALRRSMACSIEAQVESLQRRLEFNLMGNHLLENAITLCWAGLSFGGRRAEAWLAHGTPLLLGELRRQVLADGTHDERSPMYQALLAEAILRLADVAGQVPGAAAARILAAASDAGLRLLDSLQWMVHPDGHYALVNDTAGAVAPTLAALTARFGAEARTAAQHHRGWSLPVAGYSGYRAGGTYLVFDAGPLGPDHQPGHGHADMLSFELSARGLPVVTDTGVLTYASGSARRHDRGTAAHNTVEIDGRDQSDVWGSFRCGRRPSIVASRTEECRDGVTLSGAYRGAGQRGPVCHERQVFVNQQLLAFTDTITGAGAHDATLRLHLAPGTQVKRSGGTCAIVGADRRPVAAVAGAGFVWVESSSPYHPEFGRELTRPCLFARVPFRDRLVVKWWLILS